MPTWSTTKTTMARAIDGCTWRSNRYSASTRKTANVAWTRSAAKLNRTRSAWATTLSAVVVASPGT